MVQNMSDNRRKRRKRSKKSTSCSSSYSTSSEELSINNNNPTNNSSNSNGSKVQVREQVASSQMVVDCQTAQPLPPPLPDGLKEGLYELLQSEMAYHPRTDYLLNDAMCEDKVDASLRDEAMFNLRFLHKFYNLAPECFAHAVNITDRFLARVKVKPKYMSCLATAAYLIAAKMFEEPDNCPSPDKLVRFACCGGSPSDLERMAAIIRVKLRPVVATFNDDGSPIELQQQQQQPGRLESAVTPLHFLSLLAPLFHSRIEFQRAIGDLETCLCSVAVYSCRPALLALCVAKRHLLTNVHGEDGDYCVSALNCIAEHLQLTAADLASCDNVIAVESLRHHSSGRHRRHLQPRLLFSAATWPGARRLRYQLQRLQQQQQQQQQQQHCMDNSVCLSVGCGLGTIREERNV